MKHESSCLSTCQMVKKPSDQYPRGVDSKTRLIFKLPKKYADSHQCSDSVFFFIMTYESIYMINFILDSVMC